MSASVTHAPGAQGDGAGRSAFRYVVAYGGDRRSKEALRLAVVIARAFHAELELVCVVRTDDPYSHVYPPVGNFVPMITRQAAEWLDEGLALVPEDVVARAHVRSSPSVADGLIRAVEEFGAGLMVVGAASGKYTAKFSVGPVADALLHRATVPVALAPRRYKGEEAITRLYAGVGTRPGAQRIISETRRAVSRTGLELVLVNFLPSDQVHGAPEAAVDLTQRTLEDAAAEIGAQHPVSVRVAQGKNLKQTVDDISWEPGSVLFVGSSRLAGNRQIFLGTTTARILRHLPIPMIVLPRAADDDAAREGATEEALT